MVCVPRSAFPLLALASILALGACRSADTLSAADRAVRATGARTTLVLDELTVWSPYDLDLTTELARMLLEEYHATMELLELPPGEPLLVWLALSDEDPDVLSPSRDGVRGWTSRDGRQIRLFVPSAEPVRALAPTLVRDVARHEMGHVAGFRAGLESDLWRSEGLAELVEAMRLEPGHGLQPSRFPSVTFGEVRDHLDRLALRDVLAWSSQFDEVVDQEIHDAAAHALMDFLVRRERAPSFAAAVRRIDRLTDAQILALEPEWRAWLASLDYLALAERAMREGTAADRRWAVRALVTFGGDADGPFRSRRGDALALSMLDDPESRRLAAQYLVYVRYADIEPSTLAALDDSLHPYRFLVGQSVRRQRREPTDAAAARRAIRALGAEASFLRLVLERHATADVAVTPR